jgi:hypothetical protein
LPDRGCMQRCRVNQRDSQRGNFGQQRVFMPCQRQSGVTF